jgi:hypothetical protein
MFTWRTGKNGKVGRVLQTAADTSPGEEWEKVPNDWGGSPGDDLAWFDESGHRIPDDRLAADGLRADNRGRWYHTQTRETMLVYKLDDPAPGPEWTKSEPLPGEPYQKYDQETEGWIVDEEAKEAAERERKVAEKKAAIRDAEDRIQRSSLAKQAGQATPEDEAKFEELLTEIETLRAELQALLEEE